MQYPILTNKLIPSVLCHHPRYFLSTVCKTKLQVHALPWKKDAKNNKMCEGQMSQGI